ncbi:MAG: hypothetical protein U0Q22_14040 [Acidimicrobiales bacterium]
MKVSHFLESVRRIEGELDRHLDALRTRGPALWERLTTGDASTADGDDATLLGVLAAAQRIDEVGDRLATWAVRRKGERPDAAVDEVSAEVAARLDELGIPREERLPPSARPPARRRR